MSLNARGPDGLAYNPSRDLVNAYPQAIEHVARKFENGAWEALEELVESQGVTWQDLCKAMMAYTTFMASPTEDPTITMQQAMENAGWFECSPVAQIALMAMLGTTVSGQLYYAIRDTTQLGAVPEGMAVTMEKVRELLTRKHGEYACTGYNKGERTTTEDIR